MKGKNQPLVTHEPMEFEKWPVEVRGFRKKKQKKLCILQDFMEHTPNYSIKQKIPTSS